MRQMRQMRLMRSIGLTGLMGLMWLMGSCSGEQLVEPESAEKPSEEEPGLPGKAPIAFQTDLPEQQAVTRSTPLETYTSNFKVWCYKNMSYESMSEEYGDTQEVFPGYSVNWVDNSAYTTTTNTNGWEYVGQEQGSDPEQTVKYWDFGANAYRFFAVAPSTAGTISRTTESSISITLPADASVEASTTATAAEKVSATPYYSRLWFSDNSDSRYGKPVTLEFMKPLAKVRFMFTYPPVPEGVSEPVLENFDFRPEDEDTHIALQGKVTITYPKQGNRTKESWETSWVNRSKVLVSMTRPYITGHDEHWETVLPIYGPTEAGGQGAYVLKATVNGTDRSCVVPAQFMTWHPGYAYTYIFKVDAEGGLKLDNVWVGVTVMETEREEEYILYNW